MAAALITTLIDKVDNFEAIRDQVAAIIAIESTNQVALATTDGKPTPNEWALSVYTERSIPFEVWLNSPTDDEKLIPVINVWFDTAGVDPGGSNVIDRQQYNGTFNIDCYAYGEAESDGGAGFTAGDENAARNAQRGARLVRNILKASPNIYLQLRGLVGSTRIKSITQFQPELDGAAVQNIMALRISFDVSYNEFSPQYVAETLETVFIQVARDLDGKVLAELNVDFT